MDRERELRLLELITYMLASARQLPGEPAHYGPIRLVEATIRLLHIFGGEEESLSWMDELRSSLEDSIAVVMADSQEFLLRLDGQLEQLASLLVGEAE